MNKAEYLAHLATIYSKVGTPAIAKNDPVDIARRAELGQTWYSVAVASTCTDANGNEVGKTAAHFFYVYNEGDAGEYVVAADKAPEPLITTPAPVSTFLDEATNWFIANKAGVIKFSVNESMPDIEMVRYRCFGLDSNSGEMTEWFQVVWREDGVFSQAKYTGTYNV